MEHHEIIAAAGRAMSRPGAPVELQLAEVVVDYPEAQAVILRGAPTDTAGESPASVIVKRWNTPGSGLQREWAALEFLGCTAGAAGLAPGIYGGDAEARLLVLEDLARPGENSGLDSPYLLGNILFGDDPDHAAAALVGLNRAMGRLHAATLDGTAAYRSHSDDPARSGHPVHRVHDSLAGLPDLLAANAVAVTPALTDELAAAAAEIADPGPFLAFTHGDATPNNVFWHHGRARLFDLEVADVRHALIDGSFARLRYLYSVWARRLPIDVQRRALTGYREELARACPAAMDDRRFGHALLSCSAGWLAAVICYELPLVAAEDRNWGRSTLRQRIVTMIEHFAVLSEELGAFTAVATATSQLGRTLRRRWPGEDCDMRGYPAFAAVEAR